MEHQVKAVPLKIGFLIFKALRLCFLSLFILLCNCLGWKLFVEKKKFQ